MAERVIKSLQTGKTMTESQLARFVGDPNTPPDKLFSEYMAMKGPDGKPIYEEVGGDQPSQYTAREFFTENLPRSTVNFAASIPQVAKLAVTPPEDVKDDGLGQQIASGVVPGYALYRNSQLGRFMGDTVLGLVSKAIPGHQQSEETFDAVFQDLKNRYGGWDAVKQTAYTDPVGFAADVASVLTGVGGAVKGGAKVAGEAAVRTTGAKSSVLSRTARAAEKTGNALERTSQMIDPPIMATKIPGNVANKVFRGTLDDLSEWFYGSALRPGYSAMDVPSGGKREMAEIERIKDLARENNIQISAKVKQSKGEYYLDPTDIDTGYGQVNALKKNELDRIETILDEASGSTVTVSLNDALKSIKAEIDEKVANATDPKIAKQISKAWKDFETTQMANHPRSYGPISLKEARNIRKTLNSELSEAYAKERPQAYLNTKMQINSAILSQMEKALAANTNTAHLAGQITRSGKKLQGLINLESAMVGTLQARTGVNVSTAAYVLGAGGRLLHKGQVTSPWEISVILNGILGPKMEGSIAARLANRASRSAPVRSAVNVVTSAGRAQQRAQAIDMGHPRQVDLTSQPPTPPDASTEFDPFR